MIDIRLQKICKRINEWCDINNVQYDIVIDEHNLQGILIFKNNNIVELFEEIVQIAVLEGIHLEHKKTRSGDIVVMSINAISEQTLESIIQSKDEEMSFASKINNAFTTKYNHQPKQILNNIVNFDLTAKKIAEMQYKTASNSYKRSSRDKNKLSERYDYFGNILGEALDGMATPSGVQPGELFDKFARALQVLGEKMGIGPLQNKLKEQGINWQKSADGQNIVLYVLNGTTKAKQPIASINSATLEKPHDFEKQLAHIIDLAKGDAPGAFEQSKELMRQQEKAITDIAKSVAPQELVGINDASTAQGQPQPTQPQIQSAQPQARPTQPQAVQPAVAAAQTAASPKL